MWRTDIVFLLSASRMNFTVGFLSEGNRGQMSSLKRWSLASPPGRVNLPADNCWRRVENNWRQSVLSVIPSGGFHYSLQQLIQVSLRECWLHHMLPLTAVVVRRGDGCLIRSPQQARKAFIQRKRGASLRYIKLCGLTSTALYYIAQSIPCCTSPHRILQCCALCYIIKHIGTRHLM